MAWVRGFAGAVTALLLVGAGAALGWGLRGAAQRGRRTAEEPTEQERRRLREEQAAFRSLQNYTVEDAYGVKTTGGQEL